MIRLLSLQRGNNIILASTWNVLSPDICIVCSPLTSFKFCLSVTSLKNLSSLHFWVMSHHFLIVYSPLLFSSLHNNPSTLFIPSFIGLFIHPWFASPNKMQALYHLLYPQGLAHGRCSINFCRINQSIKLTKLVAML